MHGIWDWHDIVRALLSPLFVSGELVTHIFQFFFAPLFDIVLRIEYIFLYYYSIY